MNTGSLIRGLLLLLPAINVSAGGGPPAIVQVEAALRTEITSTILIPGTMMSRDDSRISLDVEGTIISILEVGDHVDKGDLLVEIDAGTYQLELQEFEKSIMPLEAKMQFYQRESQRLEKLAREKNAAKNRLDEVKSDYNEMIGELSIAEIKIKQARDRIRRTRILAPFSGVITERFKSVGEYANPGDDLLRLVNQENLEIQARTPQYTVPFIQQHNNLIVVDDDAETRADIRTIIPIGDQVSRLYELRLELDEHRWMAGHAVKVVVPTGPSKSVIAVPHDALVIRRDGIKLFRVNQTNVAELIPVTTGVANRKYIEVIGDVDAGDRVVIRGNERLRPGQEVQVRTGPTGL